MGSHISCNHVMSLAWHLHSSQAYMFHSWNHLYCGHMPDQITHSARKIMSTHNENILGWIIFKETHTLEENCIRIYTVNFLFHDNRELALLFSQYYFVHWKGQLCFNILCVNFLCICWRRMRFTNTHTQWEQRRSNEIWQPIYQLRRKWSHKLIILTLVYDTWHFPDSGWHMAEWLLHLHFTQLCVLWLR